MSDVIHPFMISKNICLSCGRHNSIKYLDLNDKPQNELIHVTKNAKCMVCGQLYFLRWLESPTEKQIIPYYSFYEDIDDFSTSIQNYATANRRVIS